MGRPPGPKKLAAIAQRDALVKQGLKNDEIRQALILAGLTPSQAAELLPTEPEPPKPKPEVTDEARQAVLDGAINFLDGIAKRISPNAADRFPELVAVKADALSWARKVKGAK